jgi:hypothetical protein
MKFLLVCIGKFDVSNMPSTSLGGARITLSRIVSGEGSAFTMEDSVYTKVGPFDQFDSIA